MRVLGEIQRQRTYRDGVGVSSRSLTDYRNCERRPVQRQHVRAVGRLESVVLARLRLPGSLPYVTNTLVIDSDSGASAALTAVQDDAPAQAQRADQPKALAAAARQSA